MYHQISLEKSEGLTISIDRLESQFAYLADHNFRTYHFKDLKEYETLQEENNVMITFDDVYEDQMRLAIPLLQKYQLKATFFMPMEFLGKTDLWNQSEYRIASVDALRSIRSSLIELGYHSYAHNRYDLSTMEELEEDIDKCRDFVNSSRLEVSPVIAYPYGKYPRNAPGKDQFTALLKKKGIQYGVRIGNRLNNYPFHDPYVIQRLDIKGDYTLSKFKRKLKYGKLLF
jgi:peptidoglycan/xylan/chitin deacetylase (PgdA/CDA1 family)